MTRRPLLRSMALGLVAAVALSACGGRGRPPQVAAVVSGQQIRSAEVDRLTTMWMRSQLRQQAEAHAHQVAEAQSAKAGPNGPAAESLSHKEVSRLVLGFLVRRALLDALAVQHAVHVDADPTGAAAAGAAPEDQLSAAGWGRSEIEGSFEAGQLSKALAQRIFPDVAISDAELHHRFDERPEVFGRSWRAKVQAASFDGPAPVAALQDAVRHGEAFPAAATRLGARQNLELGMVNSTRPLPDAIRAALGSLQPGTVSASLAAGQSSIALFVASREDLPALSFEEAKPGITSTLADEKRQDLFAHWFDDQLRGASVTVAHYFGRWDQASGEVL